MHVNLSAKLKLQCRRNFFPFSMWLQNLPKIYLDGYMHKTKHNAFTFIVPSHHYVHTEGPFYHIKRVSHKIALIFFLCLLKEPHAAGLKVHYSH